MEASHNVIDFSSVRLYHKLEDEFNEKNKPKHLEIIKTDQDLVEFTWRLVNMNLQNIEKQDLI